MRDAGARDGGRERVREARQAWVAWTSAASAALLAALAWRAASRSDPPRSAPAAGEDRAASDGLPEGVEPGRFDRASGKPVLRGRRLVLEGTLDVIDPFGRREPADGRLDLHVGPIGARAEGRSVDVRSGRWTLDLELTGDARIADLCWSSWGASASDVPLTAAWMFGRSGSDPRLPLRLPASGSLSLAARVAGEPTVRVFDEASGLERFDLEVRSLEGPWGSLRSVVPPPNAAEVERWANRYVTAHAVRAPGLAWSRVVLGRAYSTWPATERVLVLGPGASVRVRLAGWPAGGARVELCDPERVGSTVPRNAEEAPDALASIEVEGVHASFVGVPCGAHLVRVSACGRSAEARVELGPDDEAEVTLDHRDARPVDDEGPAAFVAAARVLVRLRERGQRIPIDGRWASQVAARAVGARAAEPFRARRLDDTVVPRSESADVVGGVTGELWVELSRPGEYELDLPTPRGFEAIAPRRVVLAPGDVALVDVDTTPQERFVQRASSR